MRTDFAKEFMASMHHAYLSEKSNAIPRSLSLRANRSSIITSLSSPLLFITTDKDLFFQETLNELALFKNTIPKLHSFHDLGHLFPGTDPVETAQVISTFIKNHTKKN